MMETKIPKIIHYCWLSNDEKPEKIKQCMASWSEVMPDYEIRHWGMDSFDFDSVPFLKDAIAKRKWAFVADFIRLYAVYTEGGIYLDSDVLVLKPFDNLLNDEVFIGVENPEWVIQPEPAIFGGRKDHPLFKDIMDYYIELEEVITDDVMKRVCALKGDAHNIYDKDGKFQLAVAPIIFAHYLTNYGYNSINEKQLLDSGIVVYPQPIFVNYDPARATNLTYAIHLNTQTWVNKLSLPSEGRGPVFKFCKQFNLHRTYDLWCNVVSYLKR